MTCTWYIDCIYMYYHLKLVYIVPRITSLDVFENGSVFRSLIPTSGHSNIRVDILIHCIGNGGRGGGGGVT